MFNEKKEFSRSVRMTKTIKEYVEQAEVTVSMTSLKSLS